MRAYPALRISLALLLFLHLGLKYLSPNSTILTDLILFNLIPILAGISLLLSPYFNDAMASKSIAVAVIIWGIGSASTTWNQFLTFKIWENLSDLCYLSFYPLMIFGITRALSAKRHVNNVELLDTVIIGLGATSAITGLLFRSAEARFTGSTFSIFTAIFYPVADLILLLTTCSQLYRAKLSLRGSLILIGIAIFSATDLYFLWLSLSNSYSLGSITDDGWLIGIVFISEALWHRGGESENSDNFTSTMAGISLLVCASILAIQSFVPDRFPALVIWLAFSTLLLAFFRFGVALRIAHQANTDRQFARLDELTQLPNRRAFMERLEYVRQGGVLLIDLNGFKTINDQYGHKVGDGLLRQVGLRFSRAIPKDVMVARLGGDEFGVIVDSDDEELSEIAEALRATLSYPIMINENSIEISASLGFARVRDDVAPNTREFLHQADMAMYQAKRSGVGIASWPG